LIANDTNRVRGAVLGLSQDGACTDSFENFRENSLKGDLSNDITLNPPLFSLVNTFKRTSLHDQSFNILMFCVDVVSGMSTIAPVCLRTNWLLRPPAECKPTFRHFPFIFIVYNINTFASLSLQHYTVQWARKVYAAVAEK